MHERTNLEKRTEAHQVMQPYSSPLFFLGLSELSSQIETRHACFFTLMKVLSFNLQISIAPNPKNETLKVLFRCYLFLSACFTGSCRPRPKYVLSQYSWYSFLLVVISCCICFKWIPPTQCSAEPYNFSSLNNCSEQLYVLSYILPNQPYSVF